MNETYHNGTSAVSSVREEFGRVLRGEATAAHEGTA